MADLTDFLHSHRPHDRLTADATTPAWNGYLLTVACSCGVVFERGAPWRMLSEISSCSRLRKVPAPEIGVGQVGSDEQ